MGSSRWSDDFFHAREANRVRTGASAFSYNASMHGVPPHLRRPHRKMDPFGVAFRESRDSAAHPESRAIAVLFDVTGSMGSIPVMLQKKLSNLMNLLTRKGYIPHPQILFGAIGDATCDYVPLQIGQFESGIEMDDDLGRILLEGGGGGQNTESYELAAYFMARHTTIDCFDKRGLKGYLFIIGDEKYYPAVKYNEVDNVIGDRLQANIPSAEIMRELETRYEVFYIIPSHASNGRNAGIRAAWEAILGERVLHLDNPALVCEAIALAIGLCEGKVDLAAGIDDLCTAGVDPRAAATVSEALTRVTRNHTPPRPNRVKQWLASAAQQLMLPPAGR